MRILVKCPKCDAGVAIEVNDGPSSIVCGGCQREIALQMSDSVLADRSVDACPVCGGGDFYRRKDFDPKIGVTVVAVGAIISAVFYWFGLDLIAYGVLGLAALVDLLVYGRLKDITVCYRCHSEFRGEFVQTAPGFDLHIADQLEPEYEKRIGRR